MAPRVIVIVGSGPGIGVNTASLFASKGFEAIALIARDEQRLRSDADKVQKSASSDTVKIKTYPSNIGDPAVYQQTLDKITSELGHPEVVLFNAARIAPSKIGEESLESVSNDFKVMSLGLYLTISWAKPLLEASARSREKAPYPSVFLSGGAIYNDPEPDLFSLSMQKAAQHNLMRSLDKKVRELGVHVGVASIGGEVKDEHPTMNAKNIADIYWQLYNEERGQWRHQVDVGP